MFCDASPNSEWKSRLQLTAAGAKGAFRTCAHAAWTPNENMLKEESTVFPVCISKCHFLTITIWKTFSWSLMEAEDWSDWSLLLPSEHGPLALALGTSGPFITQMAVCLLWRYLTQVFCLALWRHKSPFKPWPPRGWMVDSDLIYALKNWS